MKHPKIEDWLKAQFGPRPTNKTIEELREDLREFQSMADYVRSVLIKTELWEDRTQAAIYGIRYGENRAKDKQNEQQESN